MIPRFTKQIDSTDGAVTSRAGNKAVMIMPVNGDVTLTDLEEITNQADGTTANSDLKDKTLYEGVSYYGLFTKIHVATGTLIYCQE